MDINKLYCIDNIEGMRQLPDNFVDLTITSPPYDGLKKYKGYSYDFEAVASEIFRVTKQGGICVWVIKDSSIKGSESLTSFKNAIFFRDLGFNLHDTMIYLKENPIPQFKVKRYTDCFEYMFVFSKGKPKTCNYLEEKTKNFGRVDNNYRGQQTSNQNQYVGKKIKIIKEKKIKTNAWIYSANNGIDRTIDHPAQFPEKLAEDHILSWSNEEDLVFDPFVGSGTTAKMAKKNNRKYLGFDVSQEYIDIANERINK